MDQGNLAQSSYVLHGITTRVNNLAELTTTKTVILRWSVVDSTRDKSEAVLFLDSQNLT